MTPRQWQRVRELFDRVCDLAPERQAEALRDAGEGEAVVDKVRTMLEAERDDRLGRRLGDQAPGLVHALIGGRRVGRQFGPYTIEALIDSGGMGEIYRARRSDGSYDARVAIKFVALPSPDMAARFERERQMLARLEHPNIARLLDGGVDDDGVPYLVMEYVDGVPVDQYCDRERLSIRERLELFRAIVAAVSRAHRQLIIHRDIKPRNILVDKEGQPKLLDFGIGKHIDSGLAADPATLTRGQMLTPHYAAPEQISGGVVGTHTDGFQLGLLLDELLCGVPARQLDNTSMQQLVAKCLARPAPARERLLGAADAERIARDRRTTRERLARLLNGDLRLILEKACAIEPERRYHNVDELAEDIGRFLADRPVIARAPSRRYLLAKFVRRHRIAVAASTAAVVVLCASLIFSVLQARAAERQRRLAINEASKQEQVKNFVLDIFRNADPAVNLGRDITAESLLEQAGRQLSEQVTDPALFASISQAIGGAYFGLGLLDEAEPYLLQALERFEAAGETVSEDYAASAQTMAELSLARAQYDSAYRYHRVALESRRQLYGQAHPSMAESLLGVARAMRNRHPKAEVIAVYQQALDMIEQYAGTDSRDYARALGRLAGYHGSRGEFDTALPISRRALEIGRRVMHQNDPERASLTLLFGTVASDSGRFELARQHLNDALKMFTEIYDEHHPKALAALVNLATLAHYEGDLDGAVELSRRYVEALIEVFGPDSPKTAFGWNHLGLALLATGDFRQALQAHDQALAIHALPGASRDANRPLAWFGRGSALAGLGQTADALKAYQSALDSPAIDPNGSRYLATLLRMADVLLESGESTLAMARAEQAADLVEQFDNPLFEADTAAVLGSIQVAAGKPAEARRHLLAARQALAGEASNRADAIRRRVETQLALLESQ